MAKPRDPFIDYLLELLEPLGAVTAKRMFGGYGFFREGLMFGLVADETFYFKADTENAPDFEARDLPPFTYAKKTGQTAVMSYREAPSECLEDPHAMTQWAQQACAAARRAKVKSG